MTAAALLIEPAQVALQLKTLNVRALEHLLGHGDADSDAARIADALLDAYAEAECTAPFPCPRP